jgi:hypothetical protein
MKINIFRIKKAYICFIHGIKNGRGIYWSIRLSLYWFSSGFTFEND